MDTLIILFLGCLYTASFFALGLVSGRKEIYEEAIKKGFGEWHIKEDEDGSNKIAFRWLAQRTRKEP